MQTTYAPAIKGDLEARERLVGRLRPRIVRMARYYARCCGEDPDDLLQEAWVGLLEALPDLDVTIGTPEQYLIQRARWRLLDFIKRARVRRCAPLDDCAHETLPVLRQDHEVTGAFVTEFEGCLKPSQRRVLNCLLDGMTWREAGDALGCTSANIAYYVRQIKEEYRQWAGEAA